MPAHTRHTTRKGRQGHLGREPIRGSAVLRGGRGSGGSRRTGTWGSEPPKLPTLWCLRRRHRTVTTAAPDATTGTADRDESAGQAGGPRGARTHNPRIKRCERCVAMCRLLSRPGVASGECVAPRRWSSPSVGRHGYIFGYTTHGHAQAGARVEGLPPLRLSPCLRGRRSSLEGSASCPPRIRRSFVGRDRRGSPW
jgi:hypothetical protein